VLRDFPRNTAILFPQQVNFLNNAYLHRTARELGKHADLTLFARDVVANRIMERYFAPAAKVRMAPDMAFMLGRQTTTHEPIYDVVWLARTDEEKACGSGVEELLDLASIPEKVMSLPPFADGIPFLLTARRKGASVLVTDWYGLRASSAEHLAAFQQTDFDARSNVLLDRARLILSLGHIVITDRLHGHILCLLLGKPHLFLNNDYGKNWNFYDTWTRESPLCRLAREPREAWTLAMAAVAKAKQLGPSGMDSWSWN
jgi:exopolysaccharide biosynthesis predicted pyruvyltransferase EpsI